MNLETVNELIHTLESAGELSIKERKYLDLAKAYVQLAAENAKLADCANFYRLGFRPVKGTFGIEYRPTEQLLDDCGDTAIEAIKTPATDSIYAGIKADGAAAAGDCLKLNAQHMSEDERLRMQDAAEICYGTAARLREGAK